jgi:hypothetical protein
MKQPWQRQRASAVFAERVPPIELESSSSKANASHSDQVIVSFLLQLEMPASYPCNSGPESVRVGAGGSNEQPPVKFALMHSLRYYYPVVKQATILKTRKRPSLRFSVKLMNGYKTSGQSML